MILEFLGKSKLNVLIGSIFNTFFGAGVGHG